MKNVVATLAFLTGLAGLGLGCTIDLETYVDSNPSTSEDGLTATEQDYRMEIRTDSNRDSSEDWRCDGAYLSEQGVEQMLRLTEVTDRENIYSTYERIDRIATLFQACEDPWGLFPTTYRHITARIIKAIERREIEDTAWAKKIVVDFAGRYLENLQAVLLNERPSYAWGQYYYLADRDDVSRTRAVVVAMVAHLTLDLPYSLVAVESTDDHKDDYFVLGELMIEITPDFIEDLIYYYDTDAEDILNGFFMGDWVDGAFGPNTTITLSYQTIRTKSWNNRWLLEQRWGGWLAEREIYTAFWAIDGVLGTLDATGRI
ncbi:MAG: DUF5995 family protein [Myxococcota bacterium]|nr:DUF5995 family protein [Myxococcota bacterium]